MTLPYLEDVKVDGLTTIEIREKLENLYSKYYKEPKILVSGLGFNSKHIYVYGEPADKARYRTTGTRRFPT